jgi:hypothetical protein
MNGKDPREAFYEQQLFEAKNALFAATNIKQVKFLQSKIKYIEQRMKGKN